MATYQVQTIVDNEPTFQNEVKLSEILADLKIGGALQTLSPLEYITNQQVRWFKGVLLRALAKDTGDSVGYWETKLKLAVLPDDFQPYYVPIGKQVFPVIPSITILSKRKMNLLIKGSVKHLREGVDEKGNSLYGNHFSWVTLPAKELRK